MSINHSVKLLCIALICTTSTSLIARTNRNSRRSFVIMLSPAGDVQHPGRRIDDSFERGITLQCAEAVKQALEKENLPVTILLSQLPGDIIYNLHIASLANRLDVDLFISLHFYSTQNTRPNVYLYQFSYGDDFAKLTEDLAFYTYDQAHRFNADITTSYIQLFKSALDIQKYHHLFAVSSPYKLPFKPLIGITAPSIGFEAGLKQKNNWYNYIEPLTQAVKAIIQYK